jgi:hypothetical protein
MITIFKILRDPRLLAVACLAVTISAPFATAYVATANPAGQAESTSTQINRSIKGDRLQVSPRQRSIDGGGASQTKAPALVAGPRRLA